ncbi:MAG: PAS domain-containing protein, partial [Bacteroidia bacterium]
QAYLDLMEVTFDQVRNQRPRDLFEIHNHPHFLQEMKQKNGEDFNLELELSTLLGKRIWVEISKTVIRDNEGETIQQIEIITDITTRKLQEIQSKQRQEVLARHNQILTQISTTPFEHYKNIEHCIQKILEASAEALEVNRLGYWEMFPSAIVCVNSFDKKTDTHSAGVEIKACDFPHYFQAIQKGLAIIADDAHTHPHTYEFSEVYLKPLAINSMLDVSVRVAGEVIGILCIEHTQTYRTWTEDDVVFARAIADMISISIEADKRKKAEESQKESQTKIKQLSLVAEKATNGVLIADKEGNAVWANHAFLEMFEISMDKLLYQRPSKLFNRTGASEVEEADRLNPTNYVIEKEVLTYNGTAKWVQLNHTAIKDENDQLIQQIEILTDITDHKLAEQTLMEKQTQLQQLLDVTSNQNQRLQNFAHIVSHNIRSHSSNLSMLTTFLTPDEHDKEQQKFFEMLKKSTNKLAETVENLNEIITIQNNVNQPKTQLCIYEEIEKTTQALNTIILANEVTVQNLVEKDACIYGLKPYIESILLNMLTNAIKYRSPERKAVITFSAEKSGFFWVLAIQDNGLGIDLSKHGHKLFGMYKTFHVNADARGIGLFITKNQVEAMGGKIEVESEVDKGTIFFIYFYAND